MPVDGLVSDLFSLLVEVPPDVDVLAASDEELLLADEDALEV